MLTQIISSAEPWLVLAALTAALVSLPHPAPRCCCSDSCCWGPPQHILKVTRQAMGLCALSNLPQQASAAHSVRHCETGGASRQPHPLQGRTLGDRQHSIAAPWDGHDAFVFSAFWLFGELCLEAAVVFFHVKPSFKPIYLASNNHDFLFAAFLTSSSSLWTE